MKQIVLIFCFFFLIPVPSKAPSGFTVSVITSTSISASWQLPPLGSRNGNIMGFKMYFKEKESNDPTTILTIDDASTLTKTVTGLDKFTEYELQVLAFTSVGDGPKSSVKVVRTKEGGKRRRSSYILLSKYSNPSCTGRILPRAFFFFLSLLLRT